MRVSLQSIAIAASLGLSSVLVAQSNAKPVVELPPYENSFTVPPDLQRLVMLSDCVARVTINPGHERSYKLAGALGPTIRTEYLPQVQEVYKANSPKCTSGSLKVVHPTVSAGVEIDGKVLRRKGKTFRPGAEYVLFLVWHSSFEAYDFRFGAASIYELRNNGSVQVDDASPLSQYWTAQPVSELLDALRRM